MDPNNIRLQDTSEVACDNCQSTLFTEVVMLRKVSRLLTGQSRDGLIPVPVFACNSCEHVNKEFLPEGLA